MNTQPPPIPFSPSSTLQAPRRWMDKRRVILPLLALNVPLVILPVALVFLWIGKAFDKRGKIIATAIFVLLGGLIFQQAMKQSAETEREFTSNKAAKLAEGQAAIASGDYSKVLEMQKRYYMVKDADFLNMVSEAEKLKAKVEAEALAKKAAAEKPEKDRQAIRQAVEAAFGSPRVREVKITQIVGGPDAGKYDVDVIFTIPEGFTNAQSKRMTQDEIKQGSDKVFNCGVSVQQIVFEGHTKLIDTFGKETDQPVYIASMRQEVAQKINWENRALLEFERLWKVTLDHPAFNK